MGCAWRQGFAAPALQLVGEFTAAMHTATDTTPMYHRGRLAATALLRCCGKGDGCGSRASINVHRAAAAAAAATLKLGGRARARRWRGTMSCDEAPLEQFVRPGGQRCGVRGAPAILAQLWHDVRALCHGCSAHCTLVRPSAILATSLRGGMCSGRVIKPLIAHGAKAMYAWQLAPHGKTPCIHCCGQGHIRPSRQHETPRRINGALLMRMLS